jgi:hypothetical protein
MIEIPERVKKIHEAQAPSITGETPSKHHTMRKEEKEKELSRVGVVLKHHYHCYYYFSHNDCSYYFSTAF